MYQVDAPEHGVRLSWGINRWVLVEAREGSLQRQVSSPLQLAALLAEMGVAFDEADALASRFWHERPSDAATKAPRRRRIYFFV
jgi:hypothetical protein